MSGVAASTIIAGGALALGAGATAYSVLSRPSGGSPLQTMTPQGTARETPAYTDPAIQAAARAQESSAANAKGRASTMLTGGLGDTSPVTTDKKVLLGGNG